MAHQHGFALVAALMLLALLSVLSATALQSASVETQLSAGDRDSRLALYLAQASLREARYYAARGWGKMAAWGVNQVVVNTPPAPGLAWDTDLYRDFTLIDGTGAAFRLLSHSGTPLSPTLTVDTAAGSPVSGRFLLQRDIPAATWSAPYLVVEDDGWAGRSPADAWKNWTLWSGSGEGLQVAGSSVCPAASGVGLALRLKLSREPATGPWVLSLNPWLRALAAGTPGLPGDADAGAPGWDRAFAGSGGAALGTGSVTASQETAGSYLLTATGRAGRRQRQMVARIVRAGRADQRFGDWAVP